MRLRQRSDESVRTDTEALSREQRYRGSRTVASASMDAADCALLLDALGLEPADGLARPDAATA